MYRTGARNQAPSFPAVVRDEEIVVEPEVQAIKMITPDNPNADEQVTDFAKAMKLIGAAAYSLSDLQRAQRTDLVSLAILKLVQSPDLEKLQ